MTQPGGNSTSVHTFVLKTVGNAVVTNAIDKVHNRVGALIKQTNQISAATRKNAMSSQMAAAVHQKMAANIGNAEARLESFRHKMDLNTGAAQRAAAEFRRNEQELNVLSISLKRAEGDLQRANDLSKRDTKQKRALAQEIISLKAKMAAFADQQQKLNLIYDQAIRREKLYQASLKAREARLNLLKTKEAEAAAPLSKWQQYLVTAIKVYRAIDQISKTFARLSRAIDHTSQAATRFMHLWDRLRGRKPGTLESGMLADVGKPASGFQTNITNMTKGLGILGQTASYVFGQLIFNGIVRATQAFAGLIKASFDAVSGFETMAISLRAIIGVQKMNVDSTLKLSDALAASSKESIQLIKWLEKLAILSPFSAEDVKQAFQNAISMGFNVEQSKRLTRATLDWAAANGKSGAQAEHIVFVLGQMRNASKLTYQDLMQLAQLGIGMDTINRALAKSLGKTVEEIARMREEGQITASQAIPALIQYMEQFGGAAKDQANTIQGLLSSLGDIGPIFLRSLFGPMNEATGKIEGIVGALQTRLQGFVQFLQSNYIQTLAVTIGRGLGGIAENALTWGENVTINFANGLINGLWAVLDALSSIGNLVAHWLMPGSPPRLLPDIDRWGMETLNEYFRGFSMADYGLFDNIANTIESTLRAAFGDNQVGFLDALMGARTRLGAAIAGSGSVGGILSGLGSLPPEMQAYIETMFQIAEQTAVADAAQKALNDTIKKYDELLKPVDDALQSISNEQQDLADDSRIAQLRLIANDPNATAAEKRMALLEIERLENEKVRRKIAADAKKEIDEKQGIVDTELEKLRILQEQADLQKAFLDHQSESNRLLQDFINALEKLDKLGAGAGGAGTPKLAAAVPWGAGLPEGMREGDQKMSEFERRIDEFITKLRQKLEELRIIWGVVWTFIEEKLKPVREAWAGLQIAWGTLVTVFRATFPEIETWVARVFGEFINYLSVLLPVAITLVSNIITGFAVFWLKHHDTIMTVVEFVWNVVLRVITGIVFLILTIILGFLRLVNTNWVEVWEDIKQGLADRWHQMLLNTAAKILAIKSVLFMRFLEIKQNIADKLSEIKQNLAEKWEQIKEDTSEAVALLRWRIYARFREIKQSIEDFISEAKEKVAEKLAEIKTSFETHIGAALTYLTGLKNDFVQIGKDFVQGIIDGIAAMAGALAGAIASMVGGMFGTATDEAEEHSPSKRAAREIGLPFVQGTALGVVKGMPILEKAVAGMVNGMVTPPATAGQIAHSSVINNTNTNQFVLNANMSRNADSVLHEFAVMQALYGGG